jgi:hypothetical protein
MKYKMKKQKQFHIDQQYHQYVFLLGGEVSFTFNLFSFCNFIFLNKNNATDGAVQCHH